MAEAATIWEKTLPTVMQSVTGRGVWAALNAARPIAFEDEGNVLVIGLPQGENELAGHLRLPNHARVIEHVAGGIVGKPVRVRVIDGITRDDYDIAKRKEVERRRMQEAELAKMRTEMQARTSWDGVYEQLSRRYAALSNRSLPQSRARFFDEAAEIVAEARKGQETYDDSGERNFARCIERVSQYTEIPSTLVAVEILRRAGELA